MEYCLVASYGWQLFGLLIMQDKTKEIIEFVLHNNTNYIVEAIKNKPNLDIDKVISDLKDSRTQYGLKIQQIIELLEDKN
jgi:hypothetical protein